VLRIAEVERPVPKEDEVLVKVNASTVTRTDVELRNLAYPFVRVFTGIRRPKRTISGMEFAGVVNEAGADVTELGCCDRSVRCRGRTCSSTALPAPSERPRCSSSRTISRPT
jgi:NADPH:quinone reductase-like Zn-dependent oxidoreductase